MSSARRLTPTDVHAETSDTQGKYWPRESTDRDRLAEEVIGGTDTPELTPVVGERAILLRGGWLLFGRAGGALFAAGFLVVVARQLQPVSFGQLALFLGVATFLSIVAELGLPLLVVEMVASEPAAARPILWRALRFRLAATAAAGALVVAFAVAVGIGVATGALYALAIAASAVQNTTGSTLRALGHVVPEGVAELAVRVVTFSVGLPLVTLYPEPVTVAAAYAVGGVLAASGLLVSAHRKIARPFGRRTTVAFPMRKALGLGMNAILVTVYNRVDLWMLALLSTETAVGLYAAVYRFYEGLVLPSNALGALLAAAATRTASDSSRQRSVFLWHALVALAISSTVALGLMLAARPLVQALFGSSFLAAVPALRLLCLATVPAAALAVLAPITSLRDARATTDLIAIGIGVTATLNAVLIPWRGHVGAALAMVLSQAVMLTMLARRTRLQLRRMETGSA